MDQNKVMEILDMSMALPHYESEFELLSELKRCIEIGILCVQETPGDRPPMSAIVGMLTSTTSRISWPRNHMMDRTDTASSHDHETDMSIPNTIVMR